MSIGCIARTATFATVQMEVIFTPGSVLAAKVAAPVFRFEVKMSKRNRSSRYASPTNEHKDWSELLRDYDSQHAAAEIAELQWYSRQPSLSAAIQHAATATNHLGKRFEHQCRIRKEAIPAATIALATHEGDLATVNTFHELLALVERLVRPIFGIGPLYSYDAALRIGAYRRLMPDRVYLHAGTAKGARALGLIRRRKDWLLTAELPKALATRLPHEIENILCIYAGHFAGVKTVEASGCKSRTSRNRRPTSV